ncbi:LLM class flavin-dependent oxidoreductase [Streptomyces sp. BI20]|uniref:LLM class flavin-dependent oxidoreductase n=1 Tax=Streptomyces sp. BI20 TaxID=3403460 RepID=UPI003C74C8ED
MPAVPLGVLDLVPITTGSNAAEALRRSVDLARRAEAAGYTRYWFAEHHLNPGVAGTSPAVVIALTAAATTRIRLGSGAVQMGHRTALSTVEEFGLIDALHPGRLDLGLGRSAGRPPTRERAGAVTSTGERVAAVDAEPEPTVTTPEVVDGYTANGLRIPEVFSFAHLLGSPRFAALHRLLTQPGAEQQEYAEQVADVLALLAGSYVSSEGVPLRVVPGEGASLQVWVLGSSAGVSAEVAGLHGLPFAANYHVSPATVLEAVAAYRAAFKPSEERDRPYVTVSADVVVAETAERARELAAGYGPWVRSIRTGAGAIEYPTPAEAAELEAAWAPADHAIVADRIETRFVGTAASVADDLERLREATEADELLVTTVTHDHEARARSYELLAEEWRRRAGD